MEDATKRGDPVWKQEADKGHLGGERTLDLVPKEQVEQELRPAWRAK